VAAVGRRIVKELALPPSCVTTMSMRPSLLMSPKATPRCGEAITKSDRLLAHLLEFAVTQVAEERVALRVLLARHKLMNIVHHV